MKVTLTIKPYIEQLQTKKGYTHEVIADRSDVSRATLSRMLNRESRLVDLVTIGKLLTFFQREGLDVGIADLFAVTHTDGGDE